MTEAEVDGVFETPEIFFFSIWILPAKMRCLIGVHKYQNLCGISIMDDYKDLLDSSKNKLSIYREIIFQIENDQINWNNCLFGYDQEIMENIIIENVRKKIEQKIKLIAFK